MASQRIDLIPALTGTAVSSEAIVRLDPQDDVAIAKLPLAPGLILETPEGNLTIRQTIPSGHKVALRSRVEGESVRRYGHVIGFATMTIRPGDHVH